jgi:hypothetical protein
MSRIVVAAFLMPSTLASAEIQTVIGRAYNDNGELEYLEQHSVQYDNDRIVAIKTVFLNPEFELIGELVSDFSKGPQHGRYSFADHRHQYRDGAQVTMDRIKLYHRESPEHALKTKVLPLTNNQLFGPGLNMFILANIDAIVGGEKFRMKLVLPSKLDHYNVCIRKTRVNQERVHIRIEMESWFLKLFAPHLDLQYDLESKRLLHYSGISLIANARGDNFHVSVSYDYETQQSMLAKTANF